MPIVRTYECPHCSGRFDELHMNRDEPPPAFCKLCGHSTAMEPQVTSANINGVTAKAVDATVAEIDRGSQFRADMAAEVTGSDRGDTKVLVTDGAAPTYSTNTPVHEFMKNHAKSAPLSFQSQSNVTQFVKGMKGQKDVGAALPLMKSLTSEHALRAAALNRAGQVNK